MALGTGRLLERRAWLLAGAIVLIAGHGLIFTYVARHVRLSAWLIGGLVTVIVLKHLGVIGALLATLRVKLQRNRTRHLTDAPDARTAK